MKGRRQAVLAIGAGMLAGPLSCAVRAQGARTARIGIFGPGSAAGNAEWLVSFAGQMRALGYVEGRNLTIEARWVEGGGDALPRLAAELLALNVDVIVAVQTPFALAAKRATATIPIVMAPTADPVATGLVASLARPGGNVTGVSAAVGELAGKTLELLKDMMPAARRIGVLANADDSFTRIFLEHVEAAGRRLGVTLMVHAVRGPDQLEAAVETLAKARVDALVVQPSLPQRRVAELAQRHRLPAGAPGQLFSNVGGLLSYSSSREEQAHLAAYYVDRIMKGAKPADLPVQQPRKFEIALNLKSAKEIGLAVPPAFLARVDRVFE
ncbi:MAG: ABC transporter substrate-binding protein [Burkholderiales bacterium]|nr:ABC transporter substrate-binding protein [Burkholderiales bacterium]